MKIIMFEPKDLIDVIMSLLGIIESFLMLNLGWIALQYSTVIQRKHSF